MTKQYAETGTNEERSQVCVRLPLQIPLFAEEPGEAGADTDTAGLCDCRYVRLGSLEVRESQLVTGGLVLDTDTKEVTVDGDPVRLTAREYKILEYLMHNIGRVLSSAQIYEAVWNEPAYGTEKTVTVHIRNIREKIEINPKEPKYLKVVYGLGYKVEKC